MRRTFGLSRICQLFDVGTLPYSNALEWQQAMIKQRMAQMRAKKPTEDALMIVQHPSVYTLGRGADTKHLKFDPKKGEHELHRIERGGEVTWHGPGQLVVYPILDL